MRFVILSFLVLIVSCKQDVNTGSTQGAYFNLKNYFASESKRLNIEKPQIDKSVSKNAELERKQLNIGNWDAELRLFSESDINKPAWKDSYATVQSPEKIIYTAIDPGMRTRKIIVAKSVDGKIKQIEILNQIDNILYSSSEQLDYYPDSIYIIMKKQDVVLIGLNNYTISGRTVK